MNVVGVFWDIENCAVPHGKSAAKVATKIRGMEFYKDKSEMEFLVVCDVTKTAEDIVDDLNTAQVNVQHVAAAKKKNAADEKLRQAMRRFVDSHYSIPTRKTTVVLISGDVDFVSDLSDFKFRKGVYVVLLHNPNATEALLAAAHECHDFQALMSALPSVPSGPKTPFQYIELEVTNIPSSQEMSRADTERKLEELAKAYHGKVKYLNDKDGTAVLRFENGDKTQRAMQNMQGCMVGRRKIQLDFNKRLFGNSKPRSPSSFRKDYGHSEISSENQSGSQLVKQEFISMPNASKNLRVTRSFNRRVRDISESSCGGEASSEDLDDSVCSSDPSSTLGARRRSRNRRRKRNRGQNRASSRDSPISRTVEICKDKGIAKVSICGICSDKPFQKILDDLKKILMGNGFNSSSLELKKIARQSYLATVYLDVQNAKELLKSLDGLPYGEKCLFFKIDNTVESEISVQLHHMKLTDKPSSSPLCSQRPGEPSPSENFILPNVIVHLPVLEKLLNRALESHRENGIPLEKMLEYLKEAERDSTESIQVVPDFKGVPLEQLIKATELIEMIDGPNNVAMVVRRGSTEGDNLARPSSRGKSHDQNIFERKLIHLLENYPRHFIEMQELPDIYFKTYGTNYSDDIKRLEMVSGCHFSFSAETFSLIGRLSKTRLAFAPKYLLSTFALIVRNLLANMDGDEKQIPITDEALFAGYYEERCGRKFSIWDFGVCYFEDMIQQYMKSKQKTIRIQNGFFTLAEDLQSFLRNSKDVLVRQETYSCSMRNFDKDYISRFGSYSVLRLNYKSIIALFKEFSRDFLVTNADKNLLAVVSLTDNRRIELLQETITHILKCVQVNAVSFEQVEVLYYQASKRNLAKNLAFLPEQSLEYLVSLFDPNYEGGMMVKLNYIILKKGCFYQYMELKSMAILYHFPPHHRMALKSEFVPVFRSIFGNEAFLDLEYLVQVFKSKTDRYVTNGIEDLNVALTPEVVKLFNIISLVDPTKQNSCSNIISSYEKIFGQTVNLENLEEIFSQFSLNFVQFSECRQFLTLEKAGKYWKNVAVSKDLVKEALAFKKKTKKISRIAANFSSLSFSTDSS